MTRTQQINLESLADGPGILPYHLGTMRLTTHHHTFIQYVDLNDIEDKVSQIQRQLLTYKDRLINDTFTLYEIQINYLITKLNKILIQLQTIEPNRTKRGLVNSLGSVIKSITGNLDYTDALKYDEALRLLQINQGKTVSDFNKHISLSKEWMTKHSNALEQLVVNQEKINSTLQLILNSNIHKESSLIKYARFAQLLEIASENTEDLMQEILRIENALAFIHLSTTHHTMIDVGILQIMLDKVKSVYGNDHTLNLELREYFDIIKPGSYYSNKQIVIIFKFPIISKDSFDFYKLAIAPNKHNQSLIPPSPYIATNGNSFVYIETECPKLNHWFLCGEKFNHQLRSKLDCIHQLIANQVLKEACQFTKVTLKREAMEKLDDQHYLLSFPEEAKTQLTCGRVDHMVLQGSYLATIPLSCYLKTSEFTIINDNDELTGQPLKLIQIPREGGTASPEKNQIQLDSINLQDLHTVQEKIMAQTPVDPGNFHPNFIMYHTTIPFYIILLIGFIIMAIFILQKYNFGSFSKKQEQGKGDTGTEGTSGDMPATFSLNILK